VKSFHLNPAIIFQHNQPVGVFLKKKKMPKLKKYTSVPFPPKILGFIHAICLGLARFQSVLGQKPVSSQGKFWNIFE